MIMIKGDDTMPEEYDKNIMKEYIIGKFKAEGDFDFLKEGELDKIISTLIAEDAAYQASIGDDGVYDDDDAYERMFEKLKNTYPEYKMYCMRMVEDFLDFSEEYLVSIDAIEWE